MWSHNHIPTIVFSDFNTPSMPCHALQLVTRLHHAPINTRCFVLRSKRSRSPVSNGLPWRRRPFSRGAGLRLYSTSCGSIGQARDWIFQGENSATDQVNTAVKVGASGGGNGSSEFLVTADTHSNRGQNVLSPKMPLCRVQGRGAKPTHADQAK